MVAGAGIEPATRGFSILKKILIINLLARPLSHVIVNSHQKCHI